MITNKKTKTHKTLLTEEEIVSLFQSLYSKKYCYLNQIQRPFEEMLLSDNKSQRDYLIIHQKLRRMKSLESLANTQDNIAKLLRIIVLILYYRQKEAGEIAFKCGESKENLFVLFKGSADILKANRVQVRMTEEEYLLYLSKLYYYQERDLLEKTILINDHLFGITLANFNHIFKTSLTALKDIEPAFINYHDYKVDPITMQLDPSHIKCKKDFNAYNLFCLETACKSPLKFDKPKFLNIKDFIQRIQPEYMTYSCKEERINYESFAKKECFIYQYEHKGVINQGQHFGEAFTNTDPQSTTVIIKEKSILGIIDHSYINSSIKEYIKPPGSFSCQILLKNNIFSSVTLKVFIQIYLSSFAFHADTQTQSNVFEEGRPASKVYFINHGEYEIYSRKSIKQLTAMINYYRNDTTTNSHLQLDDYDDTMYTCMDDEHYKIKHPIILSIISGSDVLGFYDYTMNEKYSFTAKIKSNTSEYFSIDTTALTDMCMNNPSMYAHMNEYMNIKRKILLDKLIVFREKFYQQYLMLCEKKEQKRINKHIINANNKEVLPIVLSKTNQQQPLKTITIKRHLNINHNKSPPPISIISKNHQRSKKCILDCSIKDNKINEEKLFIGRANINMKNQNSIMKPSMNNSSNMKFNTISNDSHPNIFINKQLNTTESFSFFHFHCNNNQKKEKSKTQIRNIQKAIRNTKKITTLTQFWNTFHTD